MLNVTLYFLKLHLFQGRQDIISFGREVGI